MWQDQEVTRHRNRRSSAKQWRAGELRRAGHGMGPRAAWASFHFECEVHGAGLVKQMDVDRAVRSCLARAVAWTSKQEQHMMSTWKETVRQLVLEVHKVDMNSFQALEDTLSARRAIVDDLLARQRRELATAYKQMQDNLSHKTREMLQSDREVQRKRDRKADRRLILKEAQQAGRTRVEAAKAESLKALDAHSQLACSKVDRWASLFLRKKSLLQEVMGEIGPILAANLDGELRTTVAHIQHWQSQRVRRNVSEEGPTQVPGEGSSALSSLPSLSLPCATLDAGTAVPQDQPGKSPAELESAMRRSSSLASNEEAKLCRCQVPFCRAACRKEWHMS